jgi:hypothetical protein
MIELGEISGAPSRAPALDQAPPLDRRLVRKVALAAVAVLCAVSLAGSVVPRPQGLRALWHADITDSDAFALDGTTAYLNRIVGGRARLTAYDLATGAVRWDRSTGDGIGSLETAPAAGVVLLPAGEQTLGNADEQTVAISARTGAELWRAPGDIQLVEGDTALLDIYGADGLMEGMRLIRLTDHATIWSQKTPPAETETVVYDDGRPSEIVTARRGAIRIYRYADGALLESTDVPWVATKPVDSRYIDLSATSDYLVINRSNVIGSVADVYRLDTMARVWGVSSTSGLVFACGPSVCVNDGESIAAHHAATGAVRWKLDGALGLWDAGGGRLVLADGGYEGRRWLLDTAGHRIGPMIDGSLVVTAHPGGSVLLLRTTLDPDRTAVSRWNLGTGRLDLLGAVDGVGDRCDSVAHYLTCVHGDRFDVAAVA